MVTRWYRVPEVSKTGAYYNVLYKWSVGCILDDICIQRVLLPGSDCIHQQKVPIETTRTPTPSERSAYVKFGHLLKIQGLENYQKLTLEEVFQHAPPLLRDLLDLILFFNTDDRIPVDAGKRQLYCSVQPRMAHFKDLFYCWRTEFVAAVTPPPHNCF